MRQDFIGENHASLSIVIFLEKFPVKREQES